jgi:hypothetical protein
MDELYLYSSLLGLWTAITLWWIIRNKQQPQEHVKGIHNLFSCACLVKTLSLIFRLLEIATLETDSILQFWSVSSEGMSCVCLYVPWALISKGLFLTNPDLDNISMSSASCVASAIYSVYCFYIIDTRHLQPLIFMLHCWLLLCFIKCLRETKSVLISQLRELSRADVPVLAEVTLKKVGILRQFSTCIYLYFALFILICIALVCVEGSMLQASRSWAFAWQVLLAAAMLRLLYLLRARDMGELYYLHVANTVQSPLIPYYSARSSQSEPLLQEVSPSAPVVILPPHVQTSSQVLVGLVCLN